jgi:hypothetical protein
MPDLFSRFDLAVIAIEITGPDIRDLESFGFKVFRGFKTSSAPATNNFGGDDLNNLILRTIQKGGMALNSVGIVTSQPELEEKINGFK